MGLANFGSHGARVMEFGPLVDGEDGEYNGVGLVEISNIFQEHWDFFLFATVLFDRV